MYARKVYALLYVVDISMGPPTRWDPEQNAPPPSPVGGPGGTSAPKPHPSCCGVAGVIIAI